MRLSGQGVEEKLMATNYIDTELKELYYDHSKHLVTIKYMGSTDDDVEDREYTVLFKECFSATFNTWLEGAEGDIPQSPNDVAFYFHDISIRGIVVEGVSLYQVKMVIPMMDCQITCKSIEIVRSGI
ncbi:hypothetical protein [Planococcus versutus]|uniref:Uncharacterized protein n=1 Tax=Planococcus versutus TaxID=1302659 RepID=A0A1B1S5T0_9BACL|nr:hypothetical protein [Planococcus versutus]ANU28548.1 hypothetical protein I858_016330 [Planococcus versutus]